MRAFSYWTGPRPEYIDVCIKTLEKYGVQMVTDFDDSDINPRYKELPRLCWQVDCIRMAILAKHGGWWVDADTVMLRSIDGVWVGDAGCLYMEWTNRPKRVLNGIIYMSHDFASEVLWHINRKLEAWDGTINQPWAWLGEEIITPLTNHVSAWGSRLKSFFPIEVDREVQRFFKDERPEDIEDVDTIAWGLNNSWMLKHHPKEMNMPVKDMKDSKLLIHRLIYRAAKEVGYV